MPAISTLVDNFASADTGKWTFPSGVSVSGGVVTITPTTAYPTFTSAAANWDLTNDAFYIQLVQPLTSGAGTQTYFDLIASTNNSLGWLIETNGQLKPNYHRASATPTNVATIAAGSWNTTTHKFLRIRHASGTGNGTIFWEYSADGITWTSAGSWAMTASVNVPITAMSVGVGAGFYSGTAAAAGTAIWDNVNTLGLPPKRGLFLPF